MNQKGFGIKDIIAFIFVVGLSLCVVAFLYNDLSKNNQISILKNKTNNDLKSDSSINDNIDVKNYLELEQLVSEKSKLYFDTNEVNIVSLITLNQNKYIPTIYSLDKEKMDCNGYVIYEKNMVEPKTYLNCGDSYKTKNYDMSKEINY